MSRDPTYRIVSREQVTRWDRSRQTVVTGWEIHALWLATQTILPVFVAEAEYTPEKVDAEIRAAGKLDEQVAKLGQ